MNDRAVSLFEQYDITVESTRKGRGAIIAKTELGEIALVEYEGSEAHLCMEYAILESLQAVDKQQSRERIIPNKQGQLYCTDYEGKKYIVKYFFDGKECNVYEESECVLAARALATLHRCMRGLDLASVPPIKRPVLATNEESPLPLASSAAAADGEEQSVEKDSISFFSTDPYLQDNWADEIKSELEKRTAELIRVRNYIRKMTRKNDFELAFLSVFEKYMQQAKKALSILDDGCLSCLQQLQTKEHMFSHGDCTHHNILQTRHGFMLVHFEHVGAHLQVKDLYLFLRKILEKNNWCFEKGKRILVAYQDELPLSEQELKYLYARFVYPEKFWKIANAYLNRHKSFPSQRQLEKLIALEEKEAYRQFFLKKWVESQL